MNNSLNNSNINLRISWKLYQNTCLLHGLSSTGERRDDQHSGLFNLAGDEFLGHQVHAIPERRYHGDESVPIKRYQLRL